MAFKKFGKMFGLDDDRASEAVEDTYYDVDKEEAQLEGHGNNKFILIEPRAYSEAQQIVDYLKKRNAVLVKLSRVTPDQGRKIMDFLSGSIYAIGGTLNKLGGGIFLCAPKDVDIEGKMGDQSVRTKKKVEEDEFNF